MERIVTNKGVARRPVYPVAPGLIKATAGRELSEKSLYFARVFCLMVLYSVKRKVSCE